MRGSLDEDQFSVFYLGGGRVMSVVSCNQEVPAQALADPDTDLRDLVRMMNREGQS